MARVEADGIEEQIVKAIISERAEHHACTARQLSRRLGFHHSYVSEVVQRMQQRGIVGFTKEIPGSIHLTGTIEGHVDDAGELVAYTPDPDVPTSAAARKEIRLGVNAERMEARMKAKRDARAAAAAVEAAAVKPRVKKVPSTKKAAAPKKGTAASKATPTVAT